MKGWISWLSRKCTYPSWITADGEVPRGVDAPIIVADKAVHRVLKAANVAAVGDEGEGVVCGCLG